MKRWARHFLYRIVGTVVVGLLLVRFRSDGRGSQATDSGQETEQTDEQFHSRSTKDTVRMMTVIVPIRDVSLSFSRLEKRTNITRE